MRIRFNVFDIEEVQSFDFTFGEYNGVMSVFIGTYDGKEFNYIGELNIDDFNDRRIDISEWCEKRVEDLLRNGYIDLWEYQARGLIEIY